MKLGRDVLNIIENYCNPDTGQCKEKCFTKYKRFYYENKQNFRNFPKFSCSQHVLGYRKQSYIRWHKKKFLRFEDIVVEKDKSITLVLHKDKRHNYHIPANEFLKIKDIFK